MTDDMILWHKVGWSPFFSLFPPKAIKQNMLKSTCTFWEGGEGEGEFHFSHRD